jgi:hypothetical protein
LFSLPDECSIVVFLCGHFYVHSHFHFYVRRLCRFDSSVLFQVVSTNIMYFALSTPLIASCSDSIFRFGSNCVTDIETDS